MFLCRSPFEYVAHNLILYYISIASSSIWKWNGVIINQELLLETSTQFYKNMRLKIRVENNGFWFRTKENLRTIQHPGKLVKRLGCSQIFLCPKEAVVLHISAIWLSASFSFEKIFIWTRGLKFTASAPFYLVLIKIIIQVHDPIQLFLYTWNEWTSHPNWIWI